MTGDGVSGIDNDDDEAESEELDEPDIIHGEMTAVRMDSVPARQVIIAKMGWSDEVDTLFIDYL